MKELIDIFLELPPEERRGFIRGKTAHLSREKKIRFYKDILNRQPSVDIILMSLTELENLQYRNPVFFERFSFHPHSGVQSRVREILHRRGAFDPPPPDNFIRILHEGDRSDREFLVDNLLASPEPVNPQILLAVLKFDDQMLRKRLIDRIQPAHIPDAVLLVEAIRKGVVWYTRAGIVEMLGKLKNEDLFRVIDFLIADRNVEVKLKLIAALTRYPGERAEKYLRRLGEDSLLWVAKEARKALAIR